MARQLFAFGAFVLDLGRGALTRDGRPVAVGHKGLSLLNALLQAGGQVVSKAALMQAAWSDAAVEESNLPVQIAALRKLLGPQPNGQDWIATVARAGYRFAGHVQAAAGVAADTLPRDDRSAEPSERPSIAVLPLANMSGDAEQDYLADGITEDIIIALTRFRWFRVIGRSSSFAYKGRFVDSKQITRELGARYVLEGSLRRSGQQVRITAQLVDAMSASQIWAERYEMELKDAFAIQDAIAERVAGAIEPELLKTESLPASARHSGNMTAWDLVRQGTWHFHRVGKETHVKAQELFRAACRLDPELAEAHLWLARVSAGLSAYGWSDTPSGDIREGLDAALKAIQLDEKNPYAHYALAICSACANAPEQAILAAEKAIDISPSFALGHLVLGMGHLFRGDADAALGPFERGLTLNAYDPQNFVWYNLQAVAYLFAGRAGDALAAATRGRKVRPAWRPIYETLACCHAALGQPQDAAPCLDQMRQLPPAGSGLEPFKIRNPHCAERLQLLLKEAGWRGEAGAASR
jgi:TolB-like protein/Flp pilus assembly protein TadD